MGGKEGDTHTTWDTRQTTHDIGHTTPSCPPTPGPGVEVTGKSPGAGAAAPFVKLCRSRGDNPDRLLQPH